jgi:hypothetical protein
MSYDNESVTSKFRRLYNAHKIIADVNERIEKLYASATSMSPFNDGMPKQHDPKRFENIIVEYTELKSKAKKLLLQRARFDAFICGLHPYDKKLLDMRCEHNCRWNEIALKLRVSISTAKQNYKKMCDDAEKKGLFEEYL